MKKVAKFKPSAPTMEEAKEAVRTLIAWAGDDPEREGLIETPDRVARAYQEFFAGYGEDPEEILSKTFEEVEGYDEMVIVRNIRLESHCEHHMVPILGIAHIGYIPNNRVVGISKLARIVDVFGKRLQTQETMTAQIADAISNVLKPKGVAVVVDAVTHVFCAGIDSVIRIVTVPCVFGVAVLIIVDCHRVRLCTGFSAVAVTRLGISIARTACSVELRHL